MNQPNKLHRFISLAVSLALLTQLITPAFLWRPLPLVTAANDSTAANVGAPTAVTHPTQPDALSHPLTVARVQSHYQAGSTLVVSYTVSNNQPLTLLPIVPETATITDTLAILSTFDLTADANTIRSLTLSNTITAGTFISSSVEPAQSGNVFTWTLSDLPPQTDRTIVVMLQPPNTAVDFINLDSGMTASGMLWSGPVNAVARPASLAPDSIAAAALQPTLDADSHDDDMLWKTAVWQQDPLSLFNAVQQMDYEPYRGSLRGTRGTLWGAAGNAVDQASLLIAMLRAAGVPARYRHGALNTADAQSVLASAFPTGGSPALHGIAGYLPAGTETADPLNDPALIALVQDHWWVEAYLPGQGWTDLDPVYPGAAVGQSFATPGNHDRVTELSDSVRHTIRVRLKVEQYNAFPIAGTHLTTFYPLDVTFPTAELAGKQLTLGHLVASETVGVVFASVNHLFTPFLAIGENDLVVEGEPFQDLLSNFPLSSRLTTAEWLEYEISEPDGGVETFTRTVKDLIGADVRLLGGAPDLAFDLNTPPFALLDDLYVNWVLPNYEPPNPSPIFRYEEDHPAMRYNGYSFATTPQSWVLQGGATPWRSSGSNNMTSSTVGDVWSLDFEGQWLNVGFRSTASSGTVEIFIDGDSQGPFDTANGVNEVKNYTFGDLAPGAHTVAVVIVSGAVLPDYMDVWDGQPLSDGWHDAQLEEESGRFHFSRKSWWRRTENIYAYDGDYLTNFASTFNNIWFTFVGTDLTVLGHNRANTELHVVIDGVYQGVFNMTPEFAEQPFALHFPDLGEGPHVVQVYLPSAGGTVARIDAFNVNPPQFHSHTPVVEWYDFSPQESVPPSPGTGLATSIAIGDLNGDGSVELVVPGVNGRLYIYRGDGQDAGSGSPIIWTSDLVGPAAEPALADLNNDGLPEIIVSGQNGTFAFTHDGNVLWHNPNVVSYYPTESFGWGGPTVANLDLGPEPEIVIAASDDAVYVLDHEGNILFSDPIGRWPTVPVLADITGDGILDILVAREWELKLFDYFNGGQLVWTYVQTDTVNHLGGQGVFGAPAVADLTGDGQPEIIINWGHVIEALRADGSLLWRYHTNNNNLFRPSGITVADVTGDGQMNIVTASAVSAGFIIFNHLLMVLDAEGNLVWDQLVADNTASASGVATQDLTGNGVWEILWNGNTDGFLVIRGSDGKRLFNEPVTASGTVVDYPTLGDVDGDGYAEVVLGGRNGIFVVGHDGLWADSRPLWNQHNYHITNINDDWSIPISEPNSWELHNTYRTQTPDHSPAPAYQMVFTYTEGLPNVTVLTNTASISLTAAPPLYGWEYHQEWTQPLITTTFDSLLTGMQPGETRQVSAGTEVAYRLPSGFNYLTLPPLYVTAPGLGGLTPAAQSVVVGGTAVFTLTLTNVGDNPAVYSLLPGGIPAEWLAYPTTVPVSPGETVTVTITVTVPPNADPDTLTLWLDVDNGSGGADDFSAQLTLFKGLELALTPFSQEGTMGRPLTYTLTITNLETAERIYTLTTDGLADVSLPNSVTVAGNGAEAVTVMAVPLSHGPQPFTASAPLSTHTLHTTI